MLAHILPDGRRLNRPSAVGAGNANIGPRIDPQMYQQTDPVLVQSLLTQQANGVAPPFNHQIPTFVEPDANEQDVYSGRPYEQVTPKDNGYGSHPDSKYGSSREDSRYLSFSPSARLSVLDAPLPASFDSQGISYMARHGPVAASLPSKMGLLESSPSGSLPQKTSIPLDSVSNISGPSLIGRETRNRGSELGSSPFGSGDEGLGPRFMHSRRQPKPKILSTSMPRVDIPIEDSDDDAFHFSGGEEDYIPTSIHDQVFTRDEQQRRYSRTEQDRRPIIDSLSGIGTPADSSSKVGSPTAGSPSRYGTLFARQQQQQVEQYPAVATSPTSAFGHVGSPLRNSSFHLGASPSVRSASNSTKVSGDISPSFPSLSSPPRQSSMSVLSQQLSRTRISSKTADAAGDGIGGGGAFGGPGALYPAASTPSTSTSVATAGGVRYPSNAHHPTSSNSNPSVPRNLSGSSHGQGRNTDRIEEEQDGVFPMEDDFEDQQSRKRVSASGIQSNHHSHSSSSFAPAWSAVAAGTAGTGSRSGRAGIGGGGGGNRR